MHIQDNINLRRVKKTKIPDLLMMVMEGLDGNEQSLACAAAKELCNRAYRPKDAEAVERKTMMVDLLRRARHNATTILDRRHTQPNIDHLNDSLGSLVPAILADVDTTIAIIEDLR